MYRVNIRRNENRLNRVSLPQLFEVVSASCIWPNRRIALCREREEGEGRLWV